MITNPYQPRTRRRLLITLSLLSTLFALLYLCTNKGITSAPTWRKADLTVSCKSRRITKVSMLYGKRNTLYERALQTHKRHAERWGYGMDVLQNEISVGYLNKPSYLLGLVVNELAKPVGERVEWFMWVDADSILINPSIPLEIFLPPSDIGEDIHLVASKDHKGLNTGVFFLHVHQWTISMLIETLGYPIYNPEIDLGVQVDQSAMEKVLSQPTYKEGVVYLPRTWINTYEWSHAYEGDRGNLLVHFPGLGEERWGHMQKWLHIVETGPGEWEVPVKETGYLRETEEFWGRVRTAKRIVGEFEKGKRQTDKTAAAAFPVEVTRDKEVEMAVAELRKVLYEEAFDGELLQQRIDDWSVVSGN